jgi:hypothetical protein
MVQCKRRASRARAHGAPEDYVSIIGFLYKMSGAMVRAGAHQIPASVRRTRVKFMQYCMQ